MSNSIKLIYQNSHRIKLRLQDNSERVLNQGDTISVSVEDANILLIGSDFTLCDKIETSQVDVTQAQDITNESEEKEEKETTKKKRGKKQ